MLMELSTVRCILKYVPRWRFMRVESFILVKRRVFIYGKRAFPTEEDLADYTHTFWVRGERSSSSTGCCVFWPTGPISTSCACCSNEGWWSTPRIASLLISITSTPSDVGVRLDKDRHNYCDSARRCSPGCIPPIVLASIRSSYSQFHPCTKTFRDGRQNNVAKTPSRKTTIIFPSEASSFYAWKCS